MAVFEVGASLARSSAFRGPFISQRVKTIDEPEGGAVEAERERVAGGCGNSSCLTFYICLKSRGTEKALPS